MELVPGIDSRLAQLAAGDGDGLPAFWQAHPVAVRLRAAMPLAAAATLRGSLAAAALRVLRHDGEKGVLLTGDAEIGALLGVRGQPRGVAAGPRVVAETTLLVAAGGGLAPNMQLSSGRGEAADVQLDAVVYVGADARAADVAAQLLAAAGAQLASSVDARRPFAAFHFAHVALARPVTVLYAADVLARGNVSERELADARRALHAHLGLPADRPLLRSHASGGHLAGACKRLVNPHVGLPPSPVSGGEVDVVFGEYEFYHYMQDRMDDRGWGCAYRSIQTVLSWFRRQGYTAAREPTHGEMQRLLVEELQDKPRDFLGSQQWIGAFEASLLLDHLLGVSSRILNVTSGRELAHKGRELRAHFREHGTPVVVGGGVLAYTLVGVDFNDATGALAFLIVDPHYTGAEDVAAAQKAAVKWHAPDIFRADAFYNLCMPLCPAAI